MKLLDKIKLPETLRDLSTEQLQCISADLREVIIDVVSKNGGHLAASLGAVELAVALHACFNSPEDKIVWDVGHQAYAHKLLTGRLENFKTLRQKGGVSGFPNCNESAHDVFTVGHASNSISLALGLAKARDIQKENNTVIAVIGDAALSGGLAWEGINNVANSQTELIIILNDNAMSISKNVGALSNYLTQLRTNPLYVKTKARIEKLIERIPSLGTPLVKGAEKLKERTKHFLIDFKAGVIFEELGFRYFGPIDGHNIPLLMSTLRFAEEEKKPVIIHILTKKGKGYSLAEKDPTRFHGIGSFQRENGHTQKSQEHSYTSVFSQTMVKLGEKDKKIVAITAAMPDGTGLTAFAEKYPERFFDVGIAEGHAVSFAAGLAKEGLKPVVAIYSTFLQRAYDEIMQDVCLQGLPVVFVLDRAGIVGEDGPTHNGIFDLAYLHTVPGLNIMAPKDTNELQQMLYTAVQKMLPVAIRYPRGEGSEIKLDQDFNEIPFGKGEVVYASERPVLGKSLLFAAIGSMVDPCQKAALDLEKKGFSVKVLNMRFLRPLDQELLINSAQGASLVIAAEEGIVEGGFCSAISESLKSQKIDLPILSIGFPIEFIKQGLRKEILGVYGLSSDKIVASVEKKLALEAK